MAEHPQRRLICTAIRTIGADVAAGLSVSDAFALHLDRFSDLDGPSWDIVESELGMTLRHGRNLLDWPTEDRAWHTVTFAAMTDEGRAHLRLALAREPVGVYQMLGLQGNDGTIVAAFREAIAASPLLQPEEAEAC